MEKKWLGMTPKELTTIVIMLGILTALSIPLFLNFSSDKKMAEQTNHLAKALSVASAANYVHRKMHRGASIAITNCIDIANTLQNPLPSGYSIAPVDVPQDVTTYCTLIGPHSTAAVFFASGVG